MDNKQSKYISVSYKLYSVATDGGKQLEEETQEGRPFQFITGFGFSLDAFEQHIAGLAQGEKFDFTLAPSEAFGEYEQEGVHKMNREIFMVDGKFDNDNIFPGAVITLMDAEGKRFMARVTKVEADGVTIDTNHPLAGQTLQFEGTVLENRDATAEEIQSLLSHMSHGCGGNCGGDCGSEEKKGGCCGHCH